MQTVVAANNAVCKILSKINQLEGHYRLMKYCIEEPVEGGILIFNLLTRELIYMPEAEKEGMMENSYLQDHWFVVPEGTNEKEHVDLVKWIMTNQKQRKKKVIRAYTIFTTTDCNARCFYCFEKGRSRVPMSEEVAKKTVRFIANHCGGEKVKLSWFGGEPLYNLAAIDTICDGLQKEGIAYSSSMLTNGYLFTAENVDKAVRKWNLNWVQITLDGTEGVYNRAKAYIYEDTNPFQVVMESIKRLLDASIYVQIRLNMDMYNAEDLNKLVEELSKRFAGYENISVYAHHIFKTNEPLAELHSKEEWELRDAAMVKLERCIDRCGLSIKRGIRKTLKLNYCKADSGSAVTILPTGDIGVCDHFSENEFIGSVDAEGFNQEVVSSWKETVERIPECDNCFYYPDCIQLKKCANSRVCYPQHRGDLLRKNKQSMRCEYERWVSQQSFDETEEDDLC